MTEFLFIAVAKCCLTSFGRKHIRELEEKVRSIEVEKDKLEREKKVMMMMMMMVMIKMMMMMMKMKRLRIIETAQDEQEGQQKKSNN